MFKISLDKLDELFAKLAEKKTLYIPTDTAPGIAQFKKWQNGMKMTEKLKTSRSAKDLFFPQTENLVDFKISGRKIDIIDPREECEDFVIFGVRTCDAKSFEILDRVFLSEPVDTYYQNRREHGTVVTLACSRPTESCFCETFGIDPAEPAGDVSVWKTAEALYLKPNTEKGNALLTLVSDLVKDCPDTEIDSEKEKIHQIMKKLPLSGLSPDAFGGGKTEKYFNS